VAFYLPQFHPIPENDAWWGRGFTEWTNVTRARPLFRGHYQPRLPGELGFYDLRVVENQRRQVELAKLYGIDAFCFYVYWFGGRRVLELPLEQYLDHPELELPFCVCWANQNWTRRWDGSDSTVLLSQTHSAEDDLAFIEHYSKYLLDPRYVRIGDRPLLLVYRPEQLPDARATAERWRRCLRETHGMEIYLAYVQGVDNDEPGVFGFDGAVEFPPLRPRGRPLPREITAELEPVSSEVRAHVHDWRDLAEDSLSYTAPPYPLFRGVCPSWDNTPRRGDSASILGHSSPVGFQNWLLRALRETEERLPDAERLVFVNAWNEWAEGCYLEPDQRYGYAYLEAVRVASVRASVAQSTPSRPSLGVVVHAEGPRLLHEIIRRLQAIDPPPAVIVTTSPECRSEVETQVRESRLSGDVVTVGDHGCDVLPFMHVLPLCEERGHDVILKLHTGRGGGHWRDELLASLLDPGVAERVLGAFETSPQVGMVGPAGHCLATSSFPFADSPRLAALAHRLGIEHLRPDHSFFAGGMFYVRLDALAPIRAIQVDAPELGSVAGQMYASLGQVLERCFSLSVEAAGHTVRDTSGLDGPSRPPLRSGYRFVDELVAEGAPAR
jgi:lipopolysaccharide biosynthesis protein